MNSRTKVDDPFIGRRQATGGTHSNPTGFQVPTGGFTTDTGGLLDLPQPPVQRPSARPAVSSLRQDFGHAHGGYKQCLSL
jgi:hypothetical protein